MVSVLMTLQSSQSDDECCTERILRHILIRLDLSMFSLWHYKVLEHPEDEYAQASRCAVCCRIPTQAMSQTS